MMTIQKKTQFHTTPADSTALHKKHGGVTPIAPGPNIICTQSKKTLKRSKKIPVHNLLYTPIANKICIPRQGHGKKRT
jgi:hypothetical protein